MKKCILNENKLCDNCQNCYKCDLDETKICDNCMKCLDKDSYNTLVMKNIKVMTEEEYNKLEDN